MNKNKTTTNDYELRERCWVDYCLAYKLVSLENFVQLERSKPSRSVTLSVQNCPERYANSSF